MRNACGAGLALLAAMLVPVAAVAADIPKKAPAPPPPPPVFSWTGFYLGGDIGGAWSNGHITDTLDGINVSTNRSGVIGGFEAGYNYQISNFVFGIEGNFDWTSLGFTGTGVVVPGVGTLQASANTNWVSTLAGRFGVAFNQVLLYGKAGGGWVRNTASITNLTTGGSLSASNTNDGWVVGGGVEWAFNPSWSAKIEYDYVGLNHWGFNGLTLLPGDAFTVTRNIEELKLGLNYRFNWGGPLTTSY
jgi:outer membrane immunogenic protein